MGDFQKNPGVCWSLKITLLTQAKMYTNIYFLKSTVIFWSQKYKMTQKCTFYVFIICTLNLWLEAPLGGVLKIWVTGNKQKGKIRSICLNDINIWKHSCGVRWFKSSFFFNFLFHGSEKFSLDFFFLLSYFTLPFNISTHLLSEQS